MGQPPVGHVLMMRDGEAQPLVPADALGQLGVDEQTVPAHLAEPQRELRRRLQQPDGELCQRAVEIGPVSGKSHNIWIGELSWRYPGTATVLIANRQPFFDYERHIYLLEEKWTGQIWRLTALESDRKIDVWRVEFEIQD